MEIGLRQSLKTQICSNNSDSSVREHQCSFLPLLLTNFCMEKAPCHLIGADVGMFQLEYTYSDFGVMIGMLR